MKNIPLLFTIALLIMLLATIFCKAEAQNSIGLRAGYGSAWQFYGNDVDLPENADINIHSYHVNLMYNTYLLPKYISLSVAPGYVQRGAACIPGWQPIFEGDTELLLRYIELPTTVNFHLPFNNNRFNVAARVGLGASVMVNAIQKDIFLDSSEPPIRSKIPIDDSSNLNRFDYGVYSGLGFNYHLGKNILQLNTNFYASFVDAETVNTSRNRNITVSLGYAYQF